MNRKTRGMSLAILIALLIPILAMGLQNISEQPSIWIVYADNPDDSMNIAAQTFKNEMTSAGCIVRETTLSLLDSIPEYSDAITLVGHGTEEGVAVSDGIISWTSLYNIIEQRNPLHTIILACHSPAIPESKIFGFMGEIDAEAGALIATWHASHVLNLKSFDDNLFDRAIEAQKSLIHPLSRVVYFVHGYFGDPSDFEEMKDNFATIPGLVGEDCLYNEFLDFSYFSAYNVPTVGDKNLLHQGTSITDYATNFANYLIGEHDPGTQVNIVAHSLGGIITREMLRLYRTTLEAAGIDVGTVITLGTPHQGTYLANYENWFANIAVLLPYIGETAQFWPSLVFYSLFPDSPFLTILNSNPETYSDGIRWYTGAGVDYGCSLLTVLIHGEYSDLVVGESRATLAFANSAPTFLDTWHNALIKGSTATYPSVETWLSIDYDSDGLDDDMETYMYGTDCNDWDSDNDGHEILYHGTDPLDSDTDNDNLSDADEFQYDTDPLDPDTDSDGLLDGDEVHIHGTIPTAWSTDGDILSDEQEITWGYNPRIATDPINAPALIYIAKQVNGVTGYVRANHYAAMDYVKVYVKYKNSYGQWTSYYYAGTDSSPYYSGDYYVSWSLLQGYVQMCVKVEAYNSGNLLLGYDYQYVTLPGGGGGKPGVDPVPD